MKRFPGVWFGSLSLLLLFVFSWGFWGETIVDLDPRAPLSPHIFAAVALAVWMGVGHLWFQRVPKAQALTVILLGAAIVRGLLLTTDPLLSDDLWRYLWDGEVQRQGLSPYGVPPADPSLDTIAATEDWQQVRERINHPEIPTVYPPVAQGAFRFFAQSAESWRWAMVLVDLAIGGLLMFWLHRKSLDPRRSLYWCWHPLPILESAIGGHVHLLALLFLAGALIFMELKRARWAAALLSMATATLLVPAGLFFHLMKKLGVRAALIFVGLLIVIALLSIPVWDAPVTEGLGAYAGTWYSGGWLFEALGFLIGADVHDATDLTTRVLRVLMVAAWWVLAWWVRNRETWQATRILMLGFLLLSPTLHPWYALWLLLPVVISPSAGSLLLTVTVLFNYGVLDRWRGEGVWEFPEATGYWVFSLPLLILLLEGWRATRPAFSTPSRE